MAPSRRKGCFSPLVGSGKSAILYLLRSKVFRHGLPRSYGTEADMWSIGVIAYILLCGSRPFWARSESGIFRAVLKVDPSLDEAPWPSLSPGAKDFVKRLLNKDYRKRLTAAQALSRPWLSGYEDVKIPQDMIVYRLVRAYICSSSLRKAALGALAKMLVVPQLAYLQEQFQMLSPSKNGYISLQNFKTSRQICNEECFTARSRGETSCNARNNTLQSDERGT